MLSGGRLASSLRTGASASSCSIQPPGFRFLIESVRVGLIIEGEGREDLLKCLSVDCVPFGWRE